MNFTVVVLCKDLLRSPTKQTFGEDLGGISAEICRQLLGSSGGSDIFKHISSHKFDEIQMQRKHTS